MRIFIPLHWFEDSFADNVRVTLESMGHDVMTLGQISPRSLSPLPIRAFHAIVENLQGGFGSRIEYRMLKMAREFKPDLLLSTTGQISPYILDELGKINGMRRVLWWGDPPANSRRWGIVDPGWDSIFLKDREAVGKLRLLGRNAFSLHEAMNPFWHRPLSEQENRDIAIAGTYYAFRQAVALRLMTDGVGVQLYGPPPPKWSLPEILSKYSGRYIVRDEKSRVFGKAMAVLNTFPLSEGNSLNCRTFEIAGAGGLQIMEYRPVVEECFEPGKEILVFRTYDELLDHIDHANKYPSEMKIIRKAAAYRALAEHTYRNRLEFIFRMLRGVLT